ncbi:MAG: class I SAM-dependent methyltransferase [Thermomicrobiales bacterium]|nr:methyltransferase domain-containing protein [Thermomicrobiales bacterium]
MVAMIEVQDLAARASARSEALADRVFQATLATMDTALIHLGNRLGLYQALADIEPATSGEVAHAAGLNERYVREWLEQQTVSGFLDCENPQASAAERRYAVPLGHAAVLLDVDHPLYTAPLPQAIMGVLSVFPDLLAAFRSGEGIPYDQFGLDMCAGQAGMNRNLFLQDLGTEYLAQIPEVHARLSSGEPAHIADIGCGVGWSAIGMARAYPNVLVDGFDLDEASVREARRLIQASGVADRVQVHLRDATDDHLAGRYDLVTAFECIHDMSDPVSALRTMRRLAGEQGTVLVMDERVAETFDPAAGDVERYMYGFSVLHCLPAGLAEQPSVGTGTVMRASTMRDYAQQAGFADIDILPLAHPFFHFYRLVR